MDWKHYKAWLAEAVMGGGLAPMMTAFCIILLAYSAAHLTWMMVPISVDEAAPAGMVAHTAAPVQADAVALGREIVARHLFGQAQALAMGQSAADIPETQLKLTLRGVMASNDPHTATAIVVDPSGREDFYTVGKELPGGAVLKEVHAQHIVLSRGGRFETLRLPEDTFKMSQGVISSPLQGPSSSPAVAPEAGALLEQYRDQFLQDPQSLANVLQGEPYWENGRLLGFRLRPGRDAGVLAKFGIQAGDVVSEINGTSLADPAGRMELLRNISNVAQLNVSLLRNGQPYAIAIPVGR